MTPERWKKLDMVFHEALALKGEARASFLSQACGDDKELRSQADRLISAHEQEGSFMDSPVFEPTPEPARSDESLVGQDIGPYKVIRQLGRGGMGEVYLAQDRRLGRNVALKLLPADFTQDLNRVRRFEQEAQAASRLNHPNILTIYEIGQIDTTHYIVSEYVEGKTLRQQIIEGKLQTFATLDVVVQILSALGTAHSAGIVHRDIKPENIMMRPDGLVKILDFGLAKLLEPEPVLCEHNSAVGHGSVTEPGQVMGTPHYMSPEQARGVKVDSRSDIFSVGVVLYELLAGRTPFEGDTPTDVIISIVQREPQLLTHGSTEIPQELDRIVIKALQKAPEDRYQTAEQMLKELRPIRQRSESKDLEHVRGKQPLRRVIPRKVAIVGSLAVLLAVALIWMVRLKAESPAPVIAVLPFKNLSSEAESEYFVDGLTDELIRNLSLIEGLEVRSRTSSFAFKDKPRNLRDVGDQLKVNFVIEGSVLRSADKLRINAAFIRVSDDVTIWSGRFDLQSSDILNIQDEISRSVVNELRLKLGRGQRRYDTNIETYDQYLKARALLGATLIPRPNVIKSVSMFEKVIAKDPNFAPAYAGLANAYGAISVFTGPRAPDQPDREAAFAKMRPTAERALQLDPLLAEAHAAMGLVYSRELDWSSAEKAFRRAIELNPNLTAAYVHLAYMVLIPTRRFEEALKELDRAIQADPLSADPWEPRASVLLYGGRFDEAIESSRRGLALDSDNAVLKQLQARALLQKGMTTEAISILEKSGEPSKGQLGYAYAITGRRTEAETLLAESVNLPRRRAWIYAGLRDRDRVLEALEEMAAKKDPGAPLYLVFPEFDSVRDDPRVAALRKKFGLPDN